MSQLRYSDKADSVSTALDAAFRALGASVEAIKPARRGGLPDRLIGLWGDNYLVEYKAPGGKLSIKQEDWWRHWRGKPPVALTTVEDVEAFVEALGRSR